MFSKLKAVKDLRSQAKKMQGAMGQISEEGSGLRGQIHVVITGNQEVTRVTIAEGALTDKASLEFGVKEAMNDALKKLQKKMATVMKEMGGLSALKDMGL